MPRYALPRSFPRRIARLAPCLSSRRSAHSPSRDQAPPPLAAPRSRPAPPRSVSDEITGRGRPWPPGVSPRGESRDVSEVELSSKRDVIWELGTLLTLGAERSAGTDSREHGAILEAYVVMCGDPMLAKKVAFYMRRRRCGDRWKKFVAPVARIRQQRGVHHRFARRVPMAARSFATRGFFPRSATSSRCSSDSSPPHPAPNSPRFGLRLPGIRGRSGIRRRSTKSAPLPSASFRLSRYSSPKIAG